MLSLFRRIAVLLGAISYLVLLNWAYIDFISPSFSYLGYTYNPPSEGLVIIISIMAIVPSLWLPIHRERPSQFVFWLLYVMVYIPAILIPWYSLQIPVNQLLLFDIVLLFSFACLGVIYNIPLLVLPRVRISPFFFWSGFILISVIFHFYIFYIFGFQFQLISFIEVYKVRAESSRVLSENGAFANYATAWVSNVLNPFLIAIGLTKRKFSCVLLGVVGQVLIYSLTGNKTTLLAGIFILLVLFSQRKNGKNFGIYTVWGVAGIVTISCFIDLLGQTNWTTSLFVRRLIITPGLLTGFYLQFFSEHPKALLGHSIFEGFFTYPYPLQPANLIGYYFWNNPRTSANANIWADAYANFGLWGVFGFTLLLGLLLWIFDSLSSGKNPLVTTLMLSMPSFALVDAALLTTLLHHGLGLAILLIYLYPRTDSEIMIQQEIQSKRGGRGDEAKSGSP